VNDNKRFLSNMNLCIAANDAAIAAGEVQLGMRLPADYVEFLKFTNGGEGFIGKEYVILWGIEDLYSMNQSYEIKKYVPGLLIFGSNGGGEAYGFDTRSPQWPIVRVPFIGMEWGLAKPMSLTFKAFLECLYEVK
jgi:hypothetical protein